MLHYEIALAIIGITVALMGIIISFHIGFTTNRYAEQHKHLSGFFYEIERERMSTKIIISDIQQVRDSEKILKWQKQELPKDSLTLMMGFVLIVLLLIQTLFWELNQKMFTISPRDFFWFGVLLASGLMWTGVYIFNTYRIAYRSVSSFIEKHERLLDEVDRERKK